MPQNAFAVNDTTNPAGQRVPSLAGKQGDVLASSLHGIKYIQNYNGNLCVGANPSGVTLSAALATTYVGLCLSNPAANTKNLVLRNVSGSIIVAPAAVLSLGLIVGYLAAGITVHTTPLTPFSGLIGTGPAPTGLLDSACTLVGTPKWARQFVNNAASAGLPNFLAEIEGGIIIPPGGYAAIGASVAGPAAGFLGSFEWEEVAV